MSDKPSAAWYLAPIFLGIIGSAIMWYVLKDEDHPDAPKMVKKGWVIGIVLTIIPFLIMIPMLLLIPMTSTGGFDQQPTQERMEVIPEPRVVPVPEPTQQKEPEPEPLPVTEPTPSQNQCDPSYPAICIPPYPPDLDCGEIQYSNFRVVPPDPHGFDGDNDGIGCEVGSPSEPVKSSQENNCDPSYPAICIPVYPPDLDCGEISYKNFKVLQPDPHGFDGDNDGIGCESSSKITTQFSNSQNCSGNARCLTGTVTQVIDGDTIKVDGKSIRFALASAPELHEFEGDKARQFIDTICPVGSTALVDEDDGQTEGSYGRIIGVIYCNDLNLNEELLDASLGYLLSGHCSESEFSSSYWAQKYGCAITCDPSYPDVCIPPYPPDLDCGEIGYSNFRVTGSDQHGFDGDKDGIGCEKSSSSTSQSTSKTDCDPSYPDFCIPSSPPDLDCKDIPQKRFTVLQPDPHRFDGDKDGIGCES